MSNDKKSFQKTIEGQFKKYFAREFKYIEQYLD